VPVEGADTDTRTARNLVQPGLDAALCEYLAGGRDKQRVVALRVPPRPLLLPGHP
jgi:hypothetical protein